MFLRYIALFALVCAPALAQQPVSTAGEHVPTFQSKVDLVLVPVVVRDAQGRAVGNLTKADFQLFDKGRQQTIVSFSASDRTKTDLGNGTDAALHAAISEPAVATAKPAVESEGSKRYLIYLFDDVNSGFTAMADVRKAAVRHFQDNLAAGERAAIYTVSGNPHWSLLAIARSSKTPCRN